MAASLIGHEMDSCDGTVGEWMTDTGKKRRRRRMVIVGVLAIAIVLAGVWWRQHADRDRLAVGDSRPGDYSMGDGYFSDTYRLAVPGADIMVSLQTGQRGTRLDDTTDELSRIRAPHDGLLVHLDWSVISTGGVESKYVGARATDRGSSDGSVRYVGGHPARLSLRSKGRSVVVDPAVVPTTHDALDADQRDKVVAVPGDLADLRLAVTFRGRTQSVALLDGRRVLGAFAGLYRPTDNVRRAMSIEHTGAGEGGPELQPYAAAITGTMFRMPYLDGLGWAPAGREWALIEGAGYQVSAVAARWDRNGHDADYVATSRRPAVSVRVNGRQPLQTLGKPAVDSDYDRITRTQDYVFSVPSGAVVTVDVATRLSLRRTPDGDAEAPARPMLRLHTSTRHHAVVDPVVKGSR